MTWVEPEPDLIETAEGVLRLVEPTPVYARIDFVRGPDGRFLLMELELVEPSMYLRMDPQAPERFAEAFDRYVRTLLPAGANCCMLSPALAEKSQQ